MTTIGNVIRISVAFTTNATPAVAVDPGVVTAKYAKPDGTVVTPAATKDGVGLYHVDIAVDAYGTWNYGFIGTGANACAAYGRFDVDEAGI